MSNSKPGGIKDFLQGIVSGGGIAFSNTYEVTFQIDNNKEKLQASLKKYGFTVLDSERPSAYRNLTMMCEEASLPGIMANTAQVTGKYQGESGVNYATARMYQDISLSWISDANLSPIKFLNAWMETIFEDSDPQVAVRPFNSRVRLNYPDEYKCNIKIKKAERSANNVLGRQYGIYTLYEAWPYSIQSTPMSYGSSQALSVSASFHYRNWKFDGSTKIN